MSKSIDQGIKKYLEFHQLEPDDVHDFPRSLKMPTKAICIGDAIHTDYRSWKWGEDANYTHDHEADVHVYEVGSGKGSKKVPETIQKCKVLVKLGDCLSLGYNDYEEGEIELEYKNPYPGLYCTPNGKNLIVIKGGRIEFLIWGGKLDIEERGIVG